MGTSDSTQVMDIDALLLATSPDQFLRKTWKALYKFLTNFSLTIAFENINEIASFFDTTLDLNFLSYSLHYKPNKYVKYIKVLSSHHRSVFNIIIKGIFIRISDLSATDDY